MTAVDHENRIGRAFQDRKVPLLVTCTVAADPDYNQSRAVILALADAGADIILGHHAHILKAIEYYKGKPIIYSLANCPGSCKIIWMSFSGKQAESDSHFRK